MNMKGSKLFRGWIAALLSLCIVLTAAPAAVYAEDDDYDSHQLAEEDEGNEEEALNLSEEEIDTLEGENTEDSVSTGKVYEEKTKEDFDLNSPAIYIGKITHIQKSYSIYSEKDVKSKKVFSGLKDKQVEILYVGLVWVIVRYQNKLGYVKREYLSDDMTALDPVNTPPFNVQKHNYIATVGAEECYVRKSMSKEPLNEKEYKTYWVKLNRGTKLSIWQFIDGWAVVNYMRSYGYIDPNDLTDLIPVSPTDQPISKESPIAAYTSYYKMNHLLPNEDAQKKKDNLSRIWNIGHGAERIRETSLMQPGDIFDANKKNIGPYRSYKAAIGLSNGKAYLMKGGGTCQVSSTLYNAVMQLPGLTILKRRPHGPGGATYLPIHCDAAVGNDNLNFIFRNDYDFPVKVEGWSSGDGALLMVIYRAD